MITCSVLTSLPVSTSHSLAVVSMLAVPTYVLCGLNVTPTCITSAMSQTARPFRALKSLYTAKLAPRPTAVSWGELWLSSYDVMDTGNQLQ